MFSRTRVPIFEQVLLDPLPAQAPSVIGLDLHLSVAAQVAQVPPDRLEIASTLAGPSGAIRNLEGDPRHKGCLFKMHLCRSDRFTMKQDRRMAGPGPIGRRSPTIHGLRSALI
jgi:hypothetical protein